MVFIGVCVYHIVHDTWVHTYEVDTVISPLHNYNISKRLICRHHLVQTTVLTYANRQDFEYEVMERKDNGYILKLNMNSILGNSV